MEEWRDIEGYEGLYQVSNLGRVKSLDYKRTKKAKMLKPSFSEKGYHKVMLYRNKTGRAYFIHRLVADAFMPCDDNTLQINHKDEVKTNNNVDNLEWCDAKYNVNYGTRNERAAKANSRAVKCIETNKVYESFYEAEKLTGVDNSNIHKVCTGKYRTAGGYHWEFA